MWPMIGQLHAYHSEMPAEVQVLKRTEEIGEAAQALIGLNGWNRRKGTHATRDELAHVIITERYELPRSAVPLFRADPDRLRQEAAE